LFCSEECLIESDPGKYHYVAQGMLTIDNVDDAEEMKLTDEAFDVLGFTRVCLKLNDK
jgi:myosin heavy subunit